MPLVRDIVEGSSQAIKKFIIGSSKFLKVKLKMIDQNSGSQESLTREDEWDVTLILADSPKKVQKIV